MAGRRRRATLGSHEARRLALAAQGLAEPRPTGTVDRRHVRRVFRRVGVIQIDSVNVLARAQELAMFARLGAHRRDLVGAMAADAEVFEYWAHEASLLPVAVHPLVRWRMARAAQGVAWGGLVRLARERPGYIEAVFAEVRDRGPLTAAALSDPGVRQGPWWGWNHGKQALEYLFWCGRVTARRGRQFERIYDLPERVLPAEVLALPTPAETEAKKALLVQAARALGVGTATDLADYHRLNVPEARRLVAELAEDGRLVPVEVAGWGRPAFVHPEARLPRRVEARALLGPFDSLIWTRDRTERLFGFHYRLEIYTPARRRRFGYYVLPFLLGEELVARVDLKADRARRVLVVHAAHAEAGVHHHRVAGALARELADLAAWLGLTEGVEVGPAGDLSPALRRSVGGQRRAARPAPAPTPTGARRARPA